MPAETAQSLRLTDDVGATLELNRTPQRIASLVPSLSEALWWLGLGDKLVGVTRYCVRPADGFPWAERIGGTKNPDVPRIVGLSPDVVVANAEENRLKDIEELRSAGVPVFVTFPKTVTESAITLRKLGRLVGERERGNEMADAIDRAIDEAHARRASPPLRSFCAIWRKPYMAVGHGTYAQDVLHICGFESVLPVTRGRYPKVTLDDIRRLDPDVVLLPDEPFPFGPEHREDFEGWRARVVIFDGTLLSWYGPRTPEALSGLTEMALAIHDELHHPI